MYENIPRGSIEVVYNGIAPLTYDDAEVTRLKTKFAIADNELCIGTIARLDPIKNHSMMLHAFRRVLDIGIAAKLVIVGDGEERQNIESLIKQLNLTANVVLTGYEAKPQALLAMMDIYLLSSLSEGTSMTLLEAMSLGKPCVVTDAGGNPEIITHQLNGFVTPNDDASQFAAAIVHLAKDVNTRTIMATAAKERFVQHFSASSMCKHYLRFYTR
jgi:glycosyltransferase involved in cell wall biosynthesis